MAQGTFYWYFRSKDDVVAAVVDVPEWTPALVEFVHRVTRWQLALHELQAEISEVRPFTIG